MPDPVITVENLGKRYFIGHEARHDTLRDTLTHGARGLLRRWLRRGAARTREEFWALRDVSFEVNRGEVVGIIGRNGAGKSTLLKILSRITEPTTGTVRLRGRVASLLEVGTGFHPELSGRENIFLNGAILGMSRGEIRRKFDEIVAFAEVERFLDTPVKHYSSGMYVRLAFAVAAHLEPEILIVDEVLAVGDVAFQKKCLGRMNAVASQGRTVLFVSHRMPALQELCRGGLLLEHGRLTQQGPINASIERYLAGFAEIQQRDSHGLIRQVQCGTPVTHGANFWVGFRATIPAGAANPHYRATIYAETGEALLSTGSHLLANPPPVLRGTLDVRLDIPALPLVAGKYYVNVAVCDGESGDVVLERLDRAISFQVSGPGPHAKGRWPNTGCIALPHQWSAQPASTAEHLP